jgi:DNA repair protein RecO (recombination protein O)
MGASDARVDRQPAFVLHRRSYRETSLLLDLLTRDFGRVGVVARGARGSRRGPGPACQPFRPLVVSWSGRADLKTLTAVESVAAAPPIAGERLYSALYVNEVLVRALPQHDAHVRLFAAYAALLPELAATADVEPRLRGFEMLLLRELGYGLEFDRDGVTGGVLEPAGTYAFTPSVGFSAVHEDPSVPRYPGWALAEIGREDFTRPQTRRYAKRLMREALAELLGHRPLRSRAYFLARPAPEGGDDRI